VATFQSLAAAGSNSAAANHWEQLETLKSKLQAEVTKAGGNQICMESNPDLLRKLARAEWLSGKTHEASKLIFPFWAFDTKVDAAQYNPQFVSDALMLAGIYQSQGAFKHASDCYESILGYEINRFDKTDPRVARDANNLAVSLYLQANTQKDARERDKLFERSRQVFLLAASVSDDKKSPSLVSVIKSNRAYLKRDYPGANSSSGFAP
jgi:tetratricopeptide (TPR) repeat protein